MDTDDFDDTEPNFVTDGKLENQNAETLADVRQVLRELSRALRAKIDFLYAEGHGVKDLERLLHDLDKNWKLSLQMEFRFEELFRKQRDTETIIDFERIRHEIGCRLSRLRACCQSE